MQYSIHLHANHNLLHQSFHALVNQSLGAAAVTLTQNFKYIKRIIQPPLKKFMLVHA